MSIKFGLRVVLVVLPLCFFQPSGQVWPKTADAAGAEPDAAASAAAGRRAAAEWVRNDELFTAAWLKELAAAGFDPEQECPRLISRLREVADAPHFLEKARDILRSPAMDEKRRRDEFGKLLYYGNEKLDRLAGSLRALDHPGEQTWFGPPEDDRGWATAAEHRQWWRAAMTEADRLLFLAPDSDIARMGDDYLQILRKASRRPDAFKALLGLFSADPPLDAKDLLRLSEKAAEDPDAFLRDTAALSSARAFARELHADRCKDRRPFSDTEALGVYALRDDPEALRLVVEFCLEQDGSPSVFADFLARLQKDGPAKTRVWLDSLYLSDAFQVIDGRICRLDSVRMPVALYLPDAARELEKTGSAPLAAATGSKTTAPLPQEGRLANGIWVSRAHFPAEVPKDGRERDDFLPPGPTPLPDREALGLAETERLFACSVWFGGAMVGIRQVWSHDGFLGPLAQHGPQLAELPSSNEPLLLDLCNTGIPFLLLASARPPEELAAHLEYLSVMVAGHEKPYSDTPPPDAKRVKKMLRTYDPFAFLPENTAKDAVIPRFTGIATGGLFLALARTVDEAGAERLFGPIREIWIPLCDAPDLTDESEPGTDWIVLRRDEAGKALRLGRDPLPVLPPETIPLLSERRESLRANVAKICVRYSADSLRRLNQESVNMPRAELIRIMRETQREVLSIAAEAGIESLNGLAFLASGGLNYRLADKEAFNRMRAILIRPEIPLDERLRELQKALARITDKPGLRPMPRRGE